ncbi:MAG: HepT-like ribonuclease domain-containing protein [Armatimonadota bacterium]
MPRDYRLHLDDILESIEKIKEYISGMTYEEFAADTKTQDAVVRNLEIIGEAAKALPEEVRSEAHDTDWRKIIGLRNVLIHEYFGISIPIIWDIISNKLDDLVNSCNEILKRSTF